MAVGFVMTKLRGLITPLVLIIYSTLKTPNDGAECATSKHWQEYLDKQSRRRRGV